MSEDEPSVEVADAERRSRYEAVVGGRLAAVAVHERQGDVTTFVHTRTEPAFEGPGDAADAT